MSVNDIRFGTDGWRGRMAEDYTFSNVRRATAGFARHMLSQREGPFSIVIGYDKRFQSEDFAAAAAEVLAAHGIKVWLTNGATPTPVIAFAVPAHGAMGAVNITASHNPPYDNGFKVRSSTGGAIDPEGLKHIESLIPPAEDVKTLSYDKAVSEGLIEKFDPAPDYLANLNKLIDVQPIRKAGLKVIVDTMWGNGAGWLSSILNGDKTQVIEIHNTRNPIFPEMSRPEPIPPNVNVGLAKTLELQGSCCCITDGDADRCGFGDEHGHFVDQLRVYALIALYLLEIRGERGPIVKTLSTTSMLNKLGKLYDVPVYETGVGFKYVAPKMVETDAMIGGEESGGYAFRGNVPERDGILANLYLLDFMVRTHKTPSQLIDLLFSKVGSHYYDRIDTRCTAEQRDQVRARLISAQPADIGGLRVTGKNMTDGFKFELEDGGWLLVRLSGTEPIVRVYTETTRADAVQPILQGGLRLAGLA
jgi:phosphomannomutase